MLPPVLTPASPIMAAGGPLTHVLRVALAVCGHRTRPSRSTRSRHESPRRRYQQARRIRRGWRAGARLRRSMPDVGFGVLRPGRRRLGRFPVSVVSGQGLGDRLG
jgi:hypothetical protein